MNVRILQHGFTPLFTEPGCIKLTGPLRGDLSESAFMSGVGGLTRFPCWEVSLCLILFDELSQSVRNGAPRSVEVLVVH